MNREYRLADKQSVNRSWGKTLGMLSRNSSYQGLGMEFNAEPLYQVDVLLPT